MSYRSRILIFVVMVIAACLVSTGAEARRGIVVINTGETVKEIGPVLEEHRDDIRAEIGVTPLVGFVHNRFGLFYLDLWTWDGRYCLFSGDQYWEMEPEQAAEYLGLSVGDLPKPLLYRLPPGLGVVVLALVIIVIVAVRNQSKSNKVKELFEDARYQRAIDLIRQRTERPEEVTVDQPAAENAFQQGFDDAIAYLTGEGIADSEARENLQTMVNVIVESQQPAS